MTYIYRFLFITITALLLFAGTGNDSYAQTLEQHISSDSAKVGDLIEFSLTLRKDQTYNRIIYPDSAAFPEGFEMRQRQQFRVADFKDSLHYQLQFWATDTTTIPALPVQLISNNDTTTIYSEPVTIGFSSVLQSENEELRPLKPIFDFAAAWWPWLLAFLIILLLAAAGYYWYKNYYHEADKEPAPSFTPEPFLNPLKELENNLRQLKNIELTERAHFEQYYISLGDAIRQYFEQMYSIPAMESSSREIIHELDRRAIDNRMVEQTRIVLREADMVKFANFTPTQEQAKKAYAKGEEFLTVAKEIHGQRVQQMRRQHLAKVEQERKKFNEQKKESEVES